MRLRIKGQGDVKCFFCSILKSVFDQWVLGANFSGRRATLVMFSHVTGAESPNWFRTRSCNAAPSDAEEGEASDDAGDRLFWVLGELSCSLCLMSKFLIILIKS